MKKIVQPECQVGEGPVKALTPDAFKCPGNALPVQLLHVYVWILDNIGLIIKYPCAIKAVGIDYGQENKQKKQRK